MLKSVPVQDLAKAFANFGAVTAVRVSQRRGQRAAQAWVELDSSSAAARACRSTTTVVGCPQPQHIAGISTRAMVCPLLLSHCTGGNTGEGTELEHWLMLRSSAAEQVLGGQVLGVQASQTAIHTSTLPCSGSSSPARSPSSSQQGTAATPAQQPDQSASGAAGAAGSPEGRAQPPSSEQPAVALPKASIPGDPQPQPPGEAPLLHQQPLPHENVALCSERLTVFHA